MMTRGRDFSPTTVYFTDSSVGVSSFFCTVCTTARAMKSAMLIFLLLLSCMYLSTAQGSFGNCCLGHISSMRHKAKRNIQSYVRQESDGDCNIRAVIFFMKKRPKQAKRQTVCTNPNDRWVQDLITDLDRRLA